MLDFRANLQKCMLHPFWPFSLTIQFDMPTHREIYKCIQVFIAKVGDWHPLLQQSLLGPPGNDTKRHGSRQDMTSVISKPLSLYVGFQSEPIKMHVASILAVLLGDTIRHTYAQRIIYIHIGLHCKSRRLAPASIPIHVGPTWERYQATWIAIGYDVASVLAVLLGDILRHACAQRIIQFHISLHCKNWRLATTSITILVGPIWERYQST